MTDEYNLSRRKALLGLGTIGVAGAGAGLGTTAYFTDEESFTDNSITAGTLDMTVTATVEAANGYWEENADLPMEATADGEAVTGLQVEDVKPGDWGIVCFEVEVGENPGYVQISTEDWENAENGYTEPEPDTSDGGDTNDPGSPDGEGELGDEMLVGIYTPAPDGDIEGPDDLGTPVDTPTIGEFVNYLSDGHVLEQEVGPDNPLTGCLHLHIPEDVGNEIQTDSIGFDLIFNTEQVRNNDDPFNNSTSSN